MCGTVMNDYILFDVLLGVATLNHIKPPYIFSIPLNAMEHVWMRAQFMSGLNLNVVLFALEICNFHQEMFYFAGTL